MKDNIVIFFTHFDDYLDVCLDLNTNKDFDSIREMKKTLVKKRKSISEKEYHEIEADIFYKYLKMVTQ